MQNDQMEMFKKLQGLFVMISLVAKLCREEALKNVLNYIQYRQLMFAAYFYLRNSTL